MSCTAEEISEKRRIALERLKNRKFNMNVGTQSTASTSAVESNAVTVVTSPKSITSFYGNSINKKTNQLNDYENTIKSSVTNKTTNRILSQPYQNRRSENGVGESPSKNLAPVFTKTVTCSCSLITPHRFQVITSGYLAQLIEIFKTIPSRAYSNCFLYL